MSNNDLVSEFVQSGIANQISYIVSAFIATVLCAWTRRSASVNGDQVFLTSLLASWFLLVSLYYYYDEIKTHTYTHCTLVIKWL